MSDASPTTPSTPAGARRFEAVAIGGSAGAIEALHALLAALPENFAVPLMVVMHVPPDSPSYLIETLSYRTTLPVIEPDAGEALRPGRVYVAPPGYHMLVEDNHTVALSVDASVRFSRPSIDVLFESAACVYGAGLLAILLSGASDDGALGLAAVRAMGGLAWVQAPATAASPAMPEAAIARGGADEVLSPAGLVSRLAALPLLS